MELAPTPEREIQPQFEEPFPHAWLAHLSENVFAYRLLSEVDQARLRHAVRRFIATKFWEGCAGLRITEEMQVTIAGQACLLTLGFEDYWFQKHKTILVYPSGFLGIDPRERATSPDHHLGEAHEHGPIVLSWWHARWGGRYWHGHNVVLHEFAHKLMEMSAPNAGLLPLDDARGGARWKPVMTEEYRQLREDADYQRPTLLSSYGASNPAEFFAVASECFFLRPLALSQRHAALYQVLAEGYRQDPAAWRVDDAVAVHAEEAEAEELRHALSECDAILERYPDYLDGYLQRASYWSALGAFDKAIADGDRLVELAGKREKADAYCERGWIYHEAGADASAIADFSAAIYRSPDFADAYCGRGIVYASQGQFDKASADLTRALRLDPKDDDALLCRAYIRRERGNYAKALRDLQRAIRLCPHRADGYRERGLVYLHRKDYDRAIADLSEAIRLNGDDADVYVARAEAFEAIGQRRAAERDRAKAEPMQTESRESRVPRDGIVRGDAPHLIKITSSEPRPSGSGFASAP